MVFNSIFLFFYIFNDCHTYPYTVFINWLAFYVNLYSGQLNVQILFLQ